MAEKDLKKLVLKDKKGKVEVSTIIPEYVIAPVSEKEKVGELILKIDGQQVEKINLVAKSSVQRIKVWSLFVNMLKIWTMA